jgi:hypothetical protein
MHGSKSHDVEPTDGLVAWLDGHTKWIVSATGAVEMFDLSVDPTERHNLAADRDEIERARTRAREWWTAHPPQATVRRQTEALDAETLDRMRVLGY